MNDQDLAVWWVLTPYGPLVVSQGRGRGVMPLHRHVGRHCTLVLQGSIWDGENRQTARSWDAGDLVIHPSGLRHRTWFPDEEITVVSLGLSPLSTKLLGVHGLGLIRGRVGESITLGLRSSLIAASQGRGGAEEAMRLFDRLDDAFWVACTGTKVPDWLCQVRMELRADLTERPSLGRLSELVDKDPTHVSHAFSTAHGVTISRYLTRIRVLAAARLLCDPRRSITDAAHVAGFSDAAHFARIFRRLSGTTASQFRRAWAETGVARVAAPCALPVPELGTARFAG